VRGNIRLEVPGSLDPFWLRPCPQPSQSYKKRGKLSDSCDLFCVSISDLNCVIWPIYGLKNHLGWADLGRPEPPIGGGAALLGAPFTLNNSLCLMYKKHNYLFVSAFRRH